MKYGMRERISGALILIALAVIFVPLLIDEPAPREERPRPTLTIEQPVEVERRDLADPEPPASLQGDESADAAGPGEVTPIDESPVETVVAGGQDAEEGPDESTDERDGEAAASGQASEPTSSSAQADPIAELARAADQRLSRSEEAASDSARQGRSATPGGEWAVQVGSFGEPGNAERLETRLASQGYPAYRRARGNNLTSVYVGPYGSSEVAEDVMGELKAQLNLQGLLVRAGN